MSYMFGIILIGFAIICVIGSIPMGMLMAAFASDSGTAKDSFIWIVFLGFTGAALLQGLFLGHWGWRLLR